MEAKYFFVIFGSILMISLVSGAFGFDKQNQTTENYGYNKLVPSTSTSSSSSSLFDNAIGNCSAGQFISGFDTSGFKYCSTPAGTSYFAGLGLNLTGTDTFNHADTSSVSNVTNNGNQFIQNLSFDTFGHVVTIQSLKLAVGSNDITNGVINSSDINFTELTLSKFTNDTGFINQIFANATYSLNSTLTNMWNAFLNTTNLTYLRKDQWNATNTTYLRIDQWNSTNTTYLRIDQWNATNTTYREKYNLTWEGNLDVHGNETINSSNLYLNISSFLCFGNSTSRCYSNITNNGTHSIWF